MQDEVGGRNWGCGVGTGQALPLPPCIQPWHYATGASLVYNNFLIILIHIYIRRCTHLLDPAQ
jgi:hypothetical protein